MSDLIFVTYVFFHREPGTAINLFGSTSLIHPAPFVVDHPNFFPTCCSTQAISIGGVGSQAGVLGVWSTVFHDAEDPLGRFVHPNSFL